jgi:hypothetical protein
MLSNKLCTFSPKKLFWTLHEELVQPEIWTVYGSSTLITSGETRTQTLKCVIECFILFLCLFMSRSYIIFPHTKKPTTIEGSQIPTKINISSNLVTCHSSIGRGHLKSTWQLVQSGSNKDEIRVPSTVTGCRKPKCFIQLCRQHVQQSSELDKYATLTLNSNTNFNIRIHVRNQNRCLSLILTCNSIWRIRRWLSEYTWINYILWCGTDR